MKRLLCFLMVLILCLGLLPAEVLAAKDTFTLSNEEYQKAVKKAGIVSGSWHDGMSWSDSMSAYQKYCYLTEFRDNVVTPVKNRYVMAQRKADEMPGLETETDDYSLSGIRSSVYAMESKLNYFIFDLETEYNAVSNANAVISSADATEEEKAAAYRRVRKAEERLNAIGSK